MPRKKLDNIADTTFAFRLNSESREWLINRIDKVRNQLNKQAEDIEYNITKNEIILTAIKLGLKKMELKDLPKRRKRS